LLAGLCPVQRHRQHGINQAGNLGGGQRLCPRRCGQLRRAQDHRIGQRPRGASRAMGACDGQHGNSVKAQAPSIFGRQRQRQAGFGQCVPTVHWLAGTRLPQPRLCRLA
jgi:hypothetical protein